MKKIGIFYSLNSKSTSKVAEQIIEALKGNKFEIINAETVTKEQFLSFDNYILGVSTWFDGELPNYWDEFGPVLETLDLTAKRFAIFGLGDQVNYPENFVDAMGILSELIEQQHGTIVGNTSVEGYTFEQSRALRNGKMVGLVIDTKNQAAKTNERVLNWVKQLLIEFM